MASTKVSPFTSTVVAAMRKLYPEKLADSSFDNTGLLLEAPYRPHLKNSVLLTVDLTKAVADEAIARKDSIIIAYHPIIFRPLKSITLANTQQNSLLRLAQEGISVYSPHTAVDAAPEGLNDWLADIVSTAYPGTSKQVSIPSERSIITAVKDAPAGFEKAGYGRIVRFAQAETLGNLVTRIRHALHNDISEKLTIAVPQSTPLGQKTSIPIKSIGICAGSGGSLLNGLDVDLLFTGELSHHEALAAIEQGKCVITTFHSNSERGFLRERMARQLQAAYAKENQTNDIEFEVDVSEADRDPFEIVSSEFGW